MTPEETEIITNARAAYRRDEITIDQLHDIYYIVGRAQAERELENV